jgi:predicted nucleic acid-binding protein
MNLQDIVNGSTVMIDTNVLLYARNRRSPLCRQLLLRCEQGAVSGVVTLTTLAEFSHRCMVQEAQGNGLVGSNPARALSERPELVRQLSAYAESLRDLLDSALIVAESHAQDFLVALELQKQHGLLTNDSLNLAIARRHSIKDIVTADKSFDNVPGIIVYKPEDISAS